jgi:hypothetical protein
MVGYLDGGGGGGGVEVVGEGGGEAHRRQYRHGERRHRVRSVTERMHLASPRLPLPQRLRFLSLTALFQRSPSAPATSLQFYPFLLYAGCVKKKKSRNQDPHVGENKDLIWLPLIGRRTSQERVKTHG